MDRDAPDRPAWRLVAVVTVPTRLLLHEGFPWDTSDPRVHPQRKGRDLHPVRWGRSDGDDDRNDHRALAGALPHQLAKGLSSHPVEGLVVGTAR